jgi:hypothetical protein
MEFMGGKPAHGGRVSAKQGGTMALGQPEEHQYQRTGQQKEVAKKNEKQNSERPGVYQRA